MKQYLHKAEPTIKVSDALFFVTLPSLLSGSDRLEDLLSENEYISRSDLEGIGYSRESAVQELNSLLKQRRLEKIGGGRSTRYRVI